MMKGKTMVNHCIGLLVAASAIAACSSGESPQSETPDEALTASDAVARAEEWVAAQLHYCQAANHHADQDNACSAICNREDNPAWDPYRSDCSGLVSWAWGLAAPGLVTSQFSGITSIIDASSLRAGDAVRAKNDVHIMLFVGWVTQGSRATFIEEPGCATAITHAHQFDSDVSISGSSIYINYEGASFTAIRYNSFGAGGGGSCVVGGAYCGGDKLSGDPNTLYRCTGGTPTVLSHCANGCAIIPGQDDVCSGSGGGCVAGGLYCGGDKVSGDAGTLYRCNGAAAPTVVEQCSAACQVNPGADDACRASSGGCTPGGLYCGGDKIGGNASTLYRCNGAAEPSVVEACSAGCSVNPGVDDSCNASGGGCVVGGLYCGGDKVTGNPSTLYRCNGTSAPGVVEQCGNGCSVNAGTDDSCHSGGSCVVGGLYCGGDKVSGAGDTLYRCTGGSSGTVVTRCAAGCEVFSGRDDACK